MNQQPIEPISQKLIPFSTFPPADLCLTFLIFKCGFFFLLGKQHKHSHTYI